MTNSISVRSTTKAALQKGVIQPFNGSMKTLAHAVVGIFSTVGLRPVMKKVLALIPGPTPPPTSTPTCFVELVRPTDSGQILKVSGTGFNQGETVIIDESIDFHNGKEPEHQTNFEAEANLPLGGYSNSGSASTGRTPQQIPPSTFSERVVLQAD